VYLLGSLPVLLSVVSERFLPASQVTRMVAFLIELKPIEVPGIG